MRYEFTVPSDPTGPFSQSKSYNIELRPAFWFGMAMCDTQSHPQQVSTCSAANGFGQIPGRADRLVVHPASP
jgi:hypothetical protein